MVPHWEPAAGGGTKLKFSGGVMGCQANAAETGKHLVPPAVPPAAGGKCGRRRQPCRGFLDRFLLISPWLMAIVLQPRWTSVARVQIRPPGRIHAGPQRAAG